MLLLLGLLLRGLKLSILWLLRLAGSGLEADGDDAVGFWRHLLTLPGGGGAAEGCGVYVVSGGEGG